MRRSALLIVIAASTAYGQELPRHVDARIDALIKPLIGTATPGLGVVVIERGKTIHATTHGVTDVASRARFTSTTPIYIASLAKMFTALGVLQLVEEGKLALGTRLHDVIPEVPAYAHDVTIRQLINHTSGLIDHLDVGGEDRTYSFQDVLQILRDNGPLKFEPGSKSSYSNSAYVLLARVIERMSGRSYAEFVHQRFFEPLKLNHAVVAAAPAAVPTRRALGYKRSDTAFVLSDYEGGSAPGGGGVYASLQDLYQWALALRAGKVVSDATLKLASAPTVLSSGRDTEWGMGWLAESHGRKDPLSGRTYVAAFGSLRGFRALLQWYQQDDLIIIWLANSDSNAVFDALGKIPQKILLDANR